MLATREFWRIELPRILDELSSQLPNDSKLDRDAILAVHKQLKNKIGTLFESKEWDNTAFINIYNEVHALKWLEQNFLPRLIHFSKRLSSDLFLFAQVGSVFEACQTFYKNYQKGDEEGVKFLENLHKVHPQLFQVLNTLQVIEEEEENVLGILELAVDNIINDFKAPLWAIKNPEGILKDYAKLLKDLKTTPLTKITTLYDEVNVKLLKMLTDKFHRVLSNLDKDLSEFLNLNQVINRIILASAQISRNEVLAIIAAIELRQTLLHPKVSVDEINNINEEYEKYTKLHMAFYNFIYQHAIPMQRQLAKQYNEGEHSEERFLVFKFFEQAHLDASKIRFIVRNQEEFKAEYDLFSKIDDQISKSWIHDAKKSPDILAVIKNDRHLFYQRYADSLQSMKSPRQRVQLLKQLYTALQNSPHNSKQTFFDYQLLTNQFTSDLDFAHRCALEVKSVGEMKTAATNTAITALSILFQETLASPDLMFAEKVEHIKFLREQLHNLPQCKDAFEIEHIKRELQNYDATTFSMPVERLVDQIKEMDKSNHSLAHKAATMRSLYTEMLCIQKEEREAIRTLIPTIKGKLKKLRRDFAEFPELKDCIAEIDKLTPPPELVKSNRFLLSELVKIVLQNKHIKSAHLHVEVKYLNLLKRFEYRLREHFPAIFVNTDSIPTYKNSTQQREAVINFALEKLRANKKRQEKFAADKKEDTYLQVQTSPKRQLHNPATIYL